MLCVVNKFILWVGVLCITALICIDMLLLRLEGVLGVVVACKRCFSVGIALLDSVFLRSKGSRRGVRVF